MDAGPCQNGGINQTNKQTNKQKCKVWQPQRAARSKRPNTPSDGSKHNGFQTTNQAVLIPKHVSNKQTNKQKFKVRQPQRAARSKRPNTPSDGSKNNGCHTTNQEEYPSIHPTTETANSAQKTNPSPGGSRWFQSKYNAEHQPSKMSGKPTSSVPPSVMQC